MRFKVSMLMFGLIFSLGALQDANAQSGKAYQQMSQAERSEFVATQARRIATEMSGRDYEFTSAFIEDVQQALTQYTKRIGNGDGQGSTKRDLRVVYERGRTEAATLNAIFRARNVSPIFGLYIPWIESEFINLPAQKPSGAIGMYQFLPKTGEDFGLSPEDLMDVSKSADAAARYISASLKTFENDPMKEALALLAYNRGGPKLAAEVKILVNEQNKRCSICALSADRSRLDETFRYESVFYVPRFFAAAIIGENPQSFGLGTQSLSSL